jgi:Sensors of blue-light using FAD
MEPHELIYVSLAEGDVSTADLTDMLLQCRQKNTKQGITGLLAYHRHEFTQILEGDKAEILALYDKVCTDKRHRLPHVLWDGPIEQRSFEDWSMAFLTPSDISLEGKPAYSSYLKTELHQETLSSPTTMGRKMFLLSLRDEFLLK